MSCYDAYWLRQASNVTHPRGPRHDNRKITFSAILHYPLLGFGRLQGIQNTLFRFGAPESPRVSPLSAPLPEQRASKFPTLPLPVPRFLQPLNRSSYAAVGLRVYSTPLALPGLSLQSLPAERYLTVIQLTCSFTVTCLSRVPSRMNLAP